MNINFIALNVFVFYSPREIHANIVGWGCMVEAQLDKSLI
jgi:hypothetical protein